ncbi:MAG TPA: cytochrome b5 domain-containing protein [Anaerovoracaceae bacterium]|nr:cytochrome b5 domain-containing protein [Anaerovoracaceae bacterium]
MDDSWRRKTAGLTGQQELLEFTRAMLSQFDGQEGRPAYVAVNGMVYDVTDFPPWSGGIHNGILAGADQTMYFNICHKPEQLGKMRIIGRLVD